MPTADLFIFLQQHSFHNQIKLLLHMMFFQLHPANKRSNDTAILPLTDLSLSVFTLWQDRWFSLTAVCSSISPPCFVFCWVWVCVLGIRERERERADLKWVKRITKIEQTHTHKCRQTHARPNLHARTATYTHAPNWLFPWVVAAKLQQSSDTGRWCNEQTGPLLVVKASAQQSFMPGDKKE